MDWNYVSDGFAALAADRNKVARQRKHLADRWLGKQVERLSEAFKEGKLTFAQYEAKLGEAQKAAQLRAQD